jgi:hypothetical protein
MFTTVAVEVSHSPNARTLRTFEQTTVFSLFPSHISLLEFSQMTIVHPERGLAVVDRNDRRKFPVDDAERTVGCAELDALTPADESPLFAEQIDAGEPCRVIFNCSAIFGAHGDPIEIRVCTLDSRVRALAEPKKAAAPTVADNVANFVALGILALRGGEVAVDENDLVFSVRADVGTLL